MVSKETNNNNINSKKSHFTKVPSIQVDPIMSIMQVFSECKSEDKINLTVGAYRTEELKPYVFPSVRKAEKEILIDNLNSRNRGYMHPLGDLELCTELALLSFEKDKYRKSIIERQIIFWCQSLSGTGSLSILAEYIEKDGKESQKNNLFT